MKIKPNSFLVSRYFDLLHFLKDKFTVLLRYWVPTNSTCSCKFCKLLTAGWSSWLCKTYTQLLKHDMKAISVPAWIPFWCFLDEPSPLRICRGHKLFIIYKCEYSSLLTQCLKFYVPNFWIYSSENSVILLYCWHSGKGLDFFCRHTQKHYSCLWLVHFWKISSEVGPNPWSVLCTGHRPERWTMSKYFFVFFWSEIVNICTMYCILPSFYVPLFNFPDLLVIMFLL